MLTSFRRRKAALYRKIYNFYGRWLTFLAENSDPPKQLFERRHPQVAPEARNFTTALWSAIALTGSIEWLNEATCIAPNNQAWREWIKEAGEKAKTQRDNSCKAALLYGPSRVERLTRANIMQSGVFVKDEEEKLFYSIQWRGRTRILFTRVAFVNIGRVRSVFINILVAPLLGKKGTGSFVVSLTALLRSRKCMSIQHWDTRARWTGTLSMRLEDRCSRASNSNDNLLSCVPSLQVYSATLRPGNAQHNRSTHEHGAELRGRLFQLCPLVRPCFQ